MLLRSSAFNIEEFQIPDFILNKGEMVRFWVQTMPMSGNDTESVWGIRKMREMIKKLNSENKKIQFCPNRVKRNWTDYVKSKTVNEYLKSRFGFADDIIEALMAQFGIKPTYQVKNLGTGHQKVFSMLCAFQGNEIVAFDYYGLSPLTKQQLTEFVKNELSKGKSAIGFDDLAYKPEIPDTEKIVNLDIRRK